MSRKFVKKLISIEHKLETKIKGLDTIIADYTQLNYKQLSQWIIAKKLDEKDTFTCKISTKLTVREVLLGINERWGIFKKRILNETFKQNYLNYIYPNHIEKNISIAKTQKGYLIFTERYETENIKKILRKKMDLKEKVNIIIKILHLIKKLHESEITHGNINDESISINKKNQKIILRDFSKSEIDHSKKSKDKKEEDLHSVMIIYAKIFLEDATTQKDVINIINKLKDGSSNQFEKTVIKLTEKEKNNTQLETIELLKILADEKLDTTQKIKKLIKKLTNMPICMIKEI